MATSRIYYLTRYTGNMESFIPKYLGLVNEREGGRERRRRRTGRREKVGLKGREAGEDPAGATDDRAGEGGGN